MRAPEADPRSFSAAAHLGFDEADVRHRMGLRRAAGVWLETDGHADWQRALKASLLAADRDAFVLEPQTGAAAEGVARLAELLSAEPGAAGPVAPTVDACGRATQEDWCVMVREDTWRLRAACVCFPGRWVLADKAGGTVAEIHDPVPRYAADLGGRVETFMDRLGPDRVVERVNWNLWDDPRLSQPWTNDDAPTFDLPVAAEVGGRVFLRVERQTLRRLTDDAVAFAIRVHQRPLSHLAGQPGALASLREVLGGPVGAAVAPKKLGRLAGPVREWLAATPGS